MSRKKFDYKKIVATSTLEEIAEVLEKLHRFGSKQKRLNKYLKKRLKKYEKDEKIVDSP